MNMDVSNTPKWEFGILLALAACSSSTGSASNSDSGVSDSDAHLDSTTPSPDAEVGDPSATPHTGKGPHQPPTLVNIPGTSTQLPGVGIGP